MYQIQQTDAFITWLSNLRDMRAKARIVARLEAVRLGNLGDARSVGDRVYFTRRQRIVIVLLCGGDKSTQSRDIVRAKEMARAIE